MALPYYVSPEQMMADKAEYAKKGIAKGRSIVAVGQDGKPNELYRISFDGSIIDERGVAVIGGKADALLTFLKARWTAPTFSLREALRLSIEALDTVTNQKLGSEALEVAVLDRTRTGRTFRRIGSAEIKALLA